MNAKKIQAVQRRLLRVLHSWKDPHNEVTLSDSKIAIQNFNQQVMPLTTSTLQSLNTISSNLQGLSVEVKKNPSILLRGKAPSALGPGEK